MDVLARVGFLVNHAKRQASSQMPKFLGLLVDNRNLKFLVPPDKLECLEAEMIVLQESGIILKRSLAGVAGFLMSLARAFGPVTML